MRLRFILSEVVKGMGRNIAMTISVILVTCVSLLFVGVALLTQIQVSKVQEQWADRVQVSIYMCAEGDPTPQCAGKAATESQLAAVRERLESAELKPYIREVTFTDRKKAFAEFSERFADSTLASAATEEMMPESFRVSLADPSRYDVISSEFDSMAGVQSVQDQRQLIEPLLTTLNRATGLAAGLAAVMTVAAVLLITTTIRLSALSRRRQTTVMRYVGASALFIQAPFMVEGALAALIGALVAVGALWAFVHFVVAGWIAPAMGFVPFVTAHDLLIVGPILIVAAIVLALIASAFSLAKYAKV